MTNTRTELKSFLRNHSDLQFLDLLITDINGIIRGKRISISSAKKVFSNGVSLPASIFAMNIQGITVEKTGLGLEIGESDRLCIPMPHTLALEPWQKRPTAQALLQMYEGDGKTPFFADPRVVLQKTVDRFTDLDLKPVTALEMEFYLIDQQNKAGRPQPPLSSASGKRASGTQAYSIDELDEHTEFLTDIIESSHIQNLPADAIVAESAPAQFEINLKHVKDPILACDQAVLLKRLIKNVAYDHEMDTTFMAKPYFDQSGSGMHLHVSLVNSNGENVFAGDPHKPNDMLRWALGGLLATMNDSMALVCPNINSYRRFNPDFYVASAPTWGADNRTTALRLPTADANALRIENRLAGADANPFLLMSATLAGIHYGIANKIEPPKETIGNAHEQHEPSLINNLRDALRALQNSKVMNDYLGEKFIEVFIACKENELAEYEQSISDLEYLWYLHTV